MIFFRIIRIVLHLVTALWTCMIVFPFTNSEGRARRIKRWSGELLSMCRVKVTVDPAHRLRNDLRALLVANHISWLDIFVINSLLPCRFVAKSDIRDWPLIGLLCARAGTVFIARGRLRDVRRLVQQGEQVTQIDFLQTHPLIRDLSDYGLFIKTQNP